MRICQNNGAELILVTVPTIQYPWANGGWNSEKSSIMKKYAAAQEIKYLDLACDYDLVDFTTDTFDMGMHLNCLGTGKVTHFLSEYLQSIISPVGNNKLYDLMLKKYNDVLDIALLESEIDFHAYIERLSQHLDNYYYVK